MPDLRGAILRQANLSGTDIEFAKLTDVDLENAKFEPASVPSKGHLSGIRGLTTVGFDPGKHSGLVLLHAALREAGLRNLEREVTFALEHGRTQHALYSEDVGLSSKFEGVFRLVFFEWPTNYGLNYGRPLLILLALIGIMTMVYIPPIAIRKLAGKHSGLFRIMPKGRIDEAAGRFMTSDNEVVERLESKGLAIIGNAFYFSVLSAFNIGWRELNVGSWLAKLQSREYELRGKGWVRVASGVQSLVSVYMVAMWVLTYFGRPFQ